MAENDKEEPKKDGKAKGFVQKHKTAIIVVGIAVALLIFWVVHNYNKQQQTQQNQQNQPTTAGQYRIGRGGRGGRGNRGPRGRRGPPGPPGKQHWRAAAMIPTSELTYAHIDHLGGGVVNTRAY